jgi:hypothetical protein
MNEFLSLNQETDKKLITSLNIFLLLVIYYESYEIYLGFFSSYNLYYVFSAKKTGDYPFAMIKNDYIHIHHWMYCSLFLGIAIYFENVFLIGFFYGGISHGIQYSDWLEIC